jgi:prolipoprotein diacylglyceryltransferase
MALQTSDEGEKVLWCAKVILKAFCTRKQQLILTKSESYILFCCVFRFCEERVRESKRVLKNNANGLSSDIYYTCISKLFQAK